MEGLIAHVQDAAAYILHTRGPMSAMKLQKLCYYAYGYHLAWESRRLFPERFEAWTNGPVCPELYAEHRGQFTLEEGAIPGAPADLDGGERESIDLVLQAYVDFTAHQLSVMTHREPPWAHARARAGAVPLERSTEPLRDDEIFEYFDSLASATTDAAAG
jgi:uncharacterized phage-associated protein